MKQLKLIIAALFLTSPIAANANVITSVSVDCSSTYRTYDCSDLINDSGLSGGLHDDNFSNMWINDEKGADGLLTFNLGALYDLVSADIWQYTFPFHLPRGVKDFDIFGSNDGVNFNLLSSMTLSMSTGGNVAAQNVSLVTQASYIRFDITSNYGDSLYTGLSEVKFNGSVASVPEPGTLALLGLGLAGMGVTRRVNKA